MYRRIPVSSPLTARQFVRVARPRVVPAFRRLQSTTSATPVTPVTPTTPAPPPPPKPRRSAFRSVVVWTFRAIYITTLGGLVYFGYYAYLSRHPPKIQLHPDDKKKTLVILGSGWGSTSILKSLNTEGYHVIVVSPRNYFLFTPLLPSTTTGLVESRSIMQPIRHILRYKKAAVQFFEADCTSIDPVNKTITITDASDIKGDISETQIPFDYLVIGVGAQNSTFGIPGVEQHACFLKEVWDATKIRTRIMDCIEAATFCNQTTEEMHRLLHMVVVGGGPTGIEFAAELQDFFKEDLEKWFPEIADKFKVTLVEALPSVLPSFSKSLIDYTESTFREEHIELHTQTMVKEVKDKVIVAAVKQPNGTSVTEEIPYGLLVWATGNAPRPIIKDLINKIPAQTGSRRGLLVNDFLVVEGTEGIWSLGDCSATKYAPTAQVASQQGTYLARLFNTMAVTNALEADIAALKAKPETEEVKASLVEKTKQLSRVKLMKPFEYSHQGSLAYIGSDKAVADLPFGFKGGNVAAGGQLTYYFWRSAYLSKLFSLRNRTLVALDWIKVKVFGRDISRA